MRDEHQHCPCNGILLCKTCHDWAHAHPLDARRSGFIVSKHTNAPGIIPVETVWGWRAHDCEGGFIAIKRD